jgi:ferredoxin
MPEAIEIKNTPRPPNSDDFVELLGGDSAKVCSFETSLALDVLSNKQCIGCGKCLSGCSYGSIFDSGNEFDKLITRQKVKVKKILVEKIVSGKDKLEVWGYSNKHEELVESFDEIHLCAGAIGTPLLLLKSNLLTEKEILVLDSQVFYFIGFRKFRKSSVPSFALSQVTLSSKERQDLNFKASIYRCNEDTRLRIKNLLKSKIFFNLPVPKILDNFLFLGIGFLDSDDSGKIMITKVADQLEVSPLQTETNGIRQVLALIRRYLLTFKFYVMPGVFMHPSPGLGFHSGGSLPVGSKIVDDFGRLRCDPRIRISDVSILKSIPAGPHTFSSMSIVSSIIKSEYENSNHGI